MHLQVFTSSISKLKIFTLFFTVFFTLFLMSPTSSLEAAGWGKTDEVIEYADTLWNGVYVEMKGLNFQASIPNYLGAGLQNGDIFLSGEVNDEFAYMILASLNGVFTSPKTTKEFVELIQEANPSYLINVANAKKIGAKYVVDMIPLDPEDNVFWRFVATKERLIQMGTDDSNENRRLYFFENISVK